MEKLFIINGHEIKVNDFKRDSNSVSFILNHKPYSYKLVSQIGSEMIIEGEGRFKAAVSTASKEGDFFVISNGRESLVAISGNKVKKNGLLAGNLTSPMPGKIFKIIKEVGESVKKGDTILILEAMKMEHSIRADKDGIVKRIYFKIGELVQGGVTLAEVE